MVRLGLLCATMISAALAGPARGVDAKLDRQIETLVEKAGLGPVRIGVCVVECASGEVLAARHARDALIPASNMKLLTSGTALQVLGADFEFRTQVVLDGERVVVVGAGDPAFGDPALLREMQLSPGAFLDRLVESVRTAGARGIREVVVDDRIFDRDLVHPTWPTDQLNRWYCAEVTGLIFHANILQVFPTPGNKPGPAPMPAVEPSAPWIEVVNRLQTISRGATRVGALREADLRFRVFGSIVAAPDEPIDVTVHDMPAVFAHLLADRLGAAGLGTGVKWRLAEPGEVFNTQRAAVVVRTPLSTVLRRCNSDSHNLYAEALCKRIGRDVTGQAGSWGAGATVIRMEVAERAGLDAGELIIADGSGMSRENRVSAQTMATWLASLARARGADAFLASLAAPGEGTLERRFRGRRLTGEVRAKSGYINGVQCLSGYVTHASGSRVAFSVLVNNITAQTPGGRVKELHEDVVALIDRWMTESTRKAPAPATDDENLGG